VDKKSVIHPTPSQPLTPPASTLPERRVENGEAFSTRHFQATSLEIAFDLLVLEKLVIDPYTWAEQGQHKQANDRKSDSRRGD